MKKDPSKTYCNGCGEELKEGASPHPTVTRIVRANNRYGDAGPGGRVEVEERHADDLSVRNATMPLAEYEMLTAHVRKPVERPAPMLKQMIEAGLSGAIASTRAQIEHGKHAIQRAADRAVDKADQMLGRATE